MEKTLCIATLKIETLHKKFNVPLIIDSPYDYEVSIMRLYPMVK